MSRDVNDGWPFLQYRQVERYARGRFESWGHLEQQLAGAGLDYHFTEHGLAARCSGDALYEFISGRPGRFDNGAGEPDQPHWIRITDLGYVFTPPVPPATVAKLLRQEGLLERVDGRDVPTELAAGHYTERTPEQAVRFEARPGAVQRLWDYSIVQLLRTRRSEIEAAALARHAEAEAKASAEHAPMKITLRIASKCRHCAQSLTTDTVAWWQPDQHGVACSSCSPVKERSTTVPTTEEAPR